jgi:hypothetical protein
MVVRVQRSVSAAIVPKKVFPVLLEWEVRVLQDALKIIQISSVVLTLFYFWDLPALFPKFSCCYVS